MLQQPRTVVQIEDHTYWHVLARLSLEALPHPMEIRTAVTAEDGLALCRRWSPELVLLDLSLPDQDGLDLARHLAELPSPPRVLVVTIHLDEAALYRVGQSPIVGMVWKNCPDPLRELRAAVSAVLSDESYYAADVRAAMRTMRQAPDAFFKILSRREIDLLPLLGRGLTDAEIARLDHAVAATLHSHRKRIMAKLDLHSRSELMTWCMQRGFCDLTRLPDGNAGRPGRFLP